MHVIHTSAECYPVAKAGGLADVVGALPKYQNEIGIKSWVVMPAYDVAFVQQHEFEVVHKAKAHIGPHWFTYAIMREKTNELGFPLYVVDIPGRFDRPGVYIDPSSGYGYWDEFERYASFQVAVLDWISAFARKPDVIHCHDHHTALIPYMITSCPDYEKLRSVPTVLTIHNGEYHGWYDMGKRFLMPYINPERVGLLEWAGKLNALSAGIRTAWAVTTVSQSYMDELKYSSAGLESLINAEYSKSSGIINGIDTDVWNPSSDPLIAHLYGANNLTKGKQLNKEVLCNYFNLSPDRPTYAFIGRLVREKGAELLPEVIASFLSDGNEANFVILGTGDPGLQHRFREMSREFLGYFDASLQYNEKLAHQIYAGADFLLMPSKVEPCGLNQMYALRYGTIPIVRAVGGLRDTVIDMDEKDGYGICFNDYAADELLHAVLRGTTLYNDKKRLENLRKRAFMLDFSWTNSAQQYADLYKKLTKK
ncbi:MAG: glycogen synthase [Bacteroidetes bacterium]|nr:glycogen synthase [Bacteroidota bacterium]MCH8524070.1 glycogen synthase [Balneolales bacterium]